MFFKDVSNHSVDIAIPFQNKKTRSLVSLTLSNFRHHSSIIFMFFLLELLRQKHRVTIHVNYWKQMVLSSYFIHPRNFRCRLFWLGESGLEIPVNSIKRKFYQLHFYMIGGVHS